MPQTFPIAVIPGYLARPRRWRVALRAGLVFSLSLVTGVQAATTWTVCASGCTYTSIKAAIAAPTTLNGDTLAIAAGTYTEPGITVNKNLILQGKAAATTIVQAAATQGSASDRVFSISSGVTVTLRELTIRHGSIVSSYGGGLYNAGKLTLTNSTVSGNAAFAGGGLFNNSNSTLTLTNSTVSGNSAYWGGGLYNLGGTLTLTNSTVSGNAAFDYGGGLLNGGPLTLTNSTVSSNSAGGGGGLSNVGKLTLITSIVANNPHGGDCLNHGVITSQGYNLDSDRSCSLTAPTDQPGLDPLLGPLQDHGGSTFTQSLLPGSPAIDAIPVGTNGCGTTLRSDQRGVTRPQPAGGPCDIGAYEVQVAGQVLGGQVTGLTPQSVVCTNMTTGQGVTINTQAPAWNCRAAGLAVTPGDQASMRVQGTVAAGATTVGGAVTGLQPSNGGCTNLTTGQQVTFQHMAGATAQSCTVSGLVVRPGDRVQMSVQGVAE